jgi:hypothetical protein
VFSSSSAAEREQQSAVVIENSHTCRLATALAFFNSIELPVRLIANRSSFYNFLANMIMDSSRE